MDFILFLLIFIGLCGWLDHWAASGTTAGAGR
jgi:hypothetical protein